MLPLLLGLLAMLLPAPMQWRMPGHATPAPRPCPLPDPKYRVVPYPATALTGGAAPRPPRSLVVYQGPVPPPPENNWSTDDLYELFDTFEMLPPWDGDQA